MKRTERVKAKKRPFRRADLLRFTKITSTKRGLRFHFLIDDLEHSCFTSVPAHFFALPPAQQVLLSTQVGMSYLLDMAVITFPHRILVEVASLPRAAVKFWDDSYRQLTMDRIFGERLDVKVREAEWQTCGAPLGEPLPASNKGKTLLAMSGGKESLSALKLFHDLPDLTLFYLHYPSKSWHYQAVVEERLRGRYPTLKLRTDVASSQRVMDHFGCPLYGSSIIDQLVFAALLLGDEIGTLIIGNEYSSSFGNTIYQGAEVNHQCDKTLAHAQRLNAYVAEYVHRGFVYFSPFFGLYEYKIAELFFSDPQFLDLLTSCNASTKKANFCGRCPKCAFTYVILLAHSDKSVLDRYFGADLLTDLELYKPLIDFDGDKPLECVGEKKEAWLALQKIRQQPGGADSAVARYFAANIYPKIAEQLPRFEDELNREHTGFAHIPAEFRKVIKARVPNLRS